MKNNARKIALIGLFIACLAVAVVFGVPGIISYPDKELGNLISATLPRLAVAILLVALIMRSDYSQNLRLNAQGLGRAVVWSIPCFAVAIVNFPFTALIGGSAVIERVDLIWLFLLKCLSIALLEELFFRAMLLYFFKGEFAKKSNCILLAVIFSSAIFALMHVLNLFYGAGVGATLLQVGYTFLIGCMLSVMILKTKNVWLCVLVHFVFDIGGTIVTDLGYGRFQDLTFWILTAAVGTLCTVHIVLTLIKLNRKGDMPPRID